MTQGVSANFAPHFAPSPQLKPVLLRRFRVQLIKDYWHEYSKRLQPFRPEWSQLHRGENVRRKPDRRRPTRRRPESKPGVTSSRTYTRVRRRTATPTATRMSRPPRDAPVSVMGSQMNPSASEVPLLPTPGSATITPRLAART
jgi:hypothetical protein